MYRAVHPAVVLVLAVVGLASVPGPAVAGKGADRLVPSRVKISSPDAALTVRVVFRVTNRGESPGRRAEPRTVRVKLLGPEKSRHRLGKVEVGPLKAGKRVKRSVRGRLPATAAPGEYHARVCVRSGGKQRCRTSRSSIVITLPALQITPTSHDFGDVLVGVTSGFEMFSVTNTGGLATGSLETGLGGARPDEFVLGGPDSCTGRPLAGGATCTINVAYSPTEAGTAAASLEITGSPGLSAIATLAGTGLAPARARGTAPHLAGAGPFR